jgi:hypothetical protein
VSEALTPDARSGDPEDGTQEDGAMTSRQDAIRTQLGLFLRRADRRRGHRLDPAFQTRFRTMLLAFSALILVAAGLLATGVRYVIENPDTVPTSAWVPGTFIALALCIGVAILRLSDRISHRFCGPIRRICATLEAVQRGERPPAIRLRKGDEFQELAEAINATLRRLGVLD